MECVYKCYLCSKEFKEEKIIVSHIKFNHFIKENTVEMKCLVKGNSCHNGFYTFASLKSHLKKCTFVFAYLGTPSHIYSVFIRYE